VVSCTVSIGEPTNDLVKQLKAAFREVATAIRPVRTGGGGPAAEAVALVFFLLVRYQPTSSCYYQIGCQELMNLDQPITSQYRRGGL